MNYHNLFSLFYFRIIVVILVFYATTARSQNLEFDHLSLRQGLSQANVWDIHQDRFGFIWIATEDGLNTYDGYSFNVFRNDPLDSASISNSNIHTMTEDNEGGLWIGTRSGLNFYSQSKKNFERFLYDPKNKESISNNDVTCLLLDSKNNLWVGTA